MLGFGGNGKEDGNYEMSSSTLVSLNPKLGFRVRDLAFGTWGSAKDSALRFVLLIWV